MLRLIVSSHGKLAEELVESSYMIFGRQDGVFALEFDLDEDLNDIKEKYRTVLAGVPEDDQVIFLCDLFGGSPFNGAKAFIDENSKRYGLIGGVNLAMLIEAYVLRQSGKPLAEVVSMLEETGRYGISRYEAGDDIDDGC
ncbi:MAG: PTS sugar transporter subunit IIA [Ligilactobacillus ruminis]